MDGLVYDGWNHIIAREVQERIESVLPSVGAIECTAIIKEDQHLYDTVCFELYLRRTQSKENDKERIICCECALCGKDCAEIKRLGVAGLLRGIGIGSIVLKYLHEVLRQKGYKAVYVTPGHFTFKDSEPHKVPIERKPLTTNPENRVKFYKKNGYEILEDDSESGEMILWYKLR